MLAVANHKRALAGPVCHDELEAHGLGGDKRDGAVIVLARCHLAFSLAEIEGGRAGIGRDCDVAEGGTRIAAGEFGNDIGICGNDQPLTLFGELGSEIRRGGMDVAHRFGLSIEYAAVTADGASTALTSTMTK